MLTLKARGRHARAEARKKIFADAVKELEQYRDPVTGDTGSAVTTGSDESYVQTEPDIELGKAVRSTFSCPGLNLYSRL